MRILVLLVVTVTVTGGIPCGQTANDSVIQPTPVPTDPPTLPTDPPTIPTDQPTLPTDPPTIPTDPPTIPTDPPTIPTDPPTIPTDPPTIPTDPPTIPTPTVWPLGSYSLPMTTSGCPGSEWLEGAFYQDTEDNDNRNFWNTTHLGGYRKEDGFMRSFCTMVDNNTGGSWPAGSYCFLKRSACPAGFQEGLIFWDDEDNHNMNHVTGAGFTNLPDGEFTEDTMLKYCCREDGDPVTDILLPTATPFFLLMKTDVCQSVAGMSVTVWVIQWDDEDTININRREGSTPINSGSASNIGMNYCYYTPL